MALYQIGTTYINENSYPVYLLQGNAVRDAEVTQVNGKTLGKVSVAAQKNADGSTLFVGVNAWHGKARSVEAIRKMDSVFAIGTLKKREYNEKTYYDLDAEFVSVNVNLGGGYSSRQTEAAPAVFVSDTEFAALDGEDDLPF